MAIGSRTTFILGSAEGRQTAIPTDRKDRRQQQAYQYRQRNGVAHAVVGIFRVLLALAQGEESGTAVTDGQGKGQGNDCHREDHIGGAVAQIPHTPAHKNLVHDVVQG